jgi:GT2 family glycosyltransferase
MESEHFDHRIYAMWNAGVGKAREDGADYIAVLNDDIAILPGTLPVLAYALRTNPRPDGWVSDDWPELAVVCPDVKPGIVGLPSEIEVQRTTGTWASGGMTGFCFMLRADLPLPAFDEEYHWWYGDDAFEQAVRDAGYGVGRVVGLPITHRPDGSASKRWDELGPLIEKDRARWAQAWDARVATYYESVR